MNQLIAILIWLATLSASGQPTPARSSVMPGYGAPPPLIPCTDQSQGDASIMVIGRCRSRANGGPQIMGPAR